MSIKTNDDLKSLKKLQDERSLKVDSFSEQSTKSSTKSSFDEIDDLIDQIIFNDQLRFLDSKNEKSNDIEAVNSSDKSAGKDQEKDSKNAVDKFIEQMDLTPEQIELLQKEFDQIMKELFSLLAEIGGLLSELGSPPDPQKLALLKAKMQLLSSLRSRMMRFSLMAGPKYQKSFNFKYYFENLQTFVKENEPQLRQLGLDANLGKENSASKNLALVLERQKLLEGLLEKLNTFEKDLDNEKDPKKRANLTIQIEQLKEQILTLENEIKEQLEASDIGQESEKENESSAGFELELEEAAASMFAELNGLVHGQRFGQYQLLAGQSMNVHKTFAEVMDDFDIGGEEIENIREADIEKTNSVEKVVRAGAEIEVTKDVTHLVEKAASSTIGLDAPNPLP